MSAYRGKKDCASITCTRMFGPDGISKDCYGWHCTVCDAPTDAQGQCGNDHEGTAA